MCVKWGSIRKLLFPVNLHQGITQHTCGCRVITYGSLHTHSSV